MSLQCSSQATILGTFCVRDMAHTSRFYLQAKSMNNSDSRFECLKGGSLRADETQVKDFRTNPLAPLALFNKLQNVASCGSFSGLLNVFENNTGMLFSTPKNVGCESHAHGSSRQLSVLTIFYLEGRG